MLSLRDAQNFNSMNKILCFLFPLLLFMIPARQGIAQMEINGSILYGDEWINYNQDFVKITVAEDGIYRISYAELASAGVFSGGNSPSGANFQLFYMGEEIPVYVSTSGTLNNGDFIEFYGRKNRGQIDKFLYDDHSHHLNPEWSFFTDESNYFLTWNSSTNNVQYNNITNNLSNPPAAESYCMERKILQYQQKLLRGKPILSDAYACKYDVGEGWAKNTFTHNQTFTINTPAKYNSGPDASVEIRLMTQGDSHDHLVQVNGTDYVSNTFFGWSVQKYAFNVPASSLNNSNDIKIQGLVSNEDDFRVSNIYLDYPRTFDFENNNLFRFTVHANGNDQYLLITNFDHGGVAPVLFDQSNQVRIETTLSGDDVRVVLPASTTDRDLVLTSTAAVKTALNVVERNFTQYDFDNANHNYILISHPLLTDDGAGNNYVSQYADYRRSVPGGSFDVLVVDVTQLFDQFGYGVKFHEAAVRNFMSKAAIHWNPEHLFLLGKGLEYAKYRSNSDPSQSMVPTFGYPNSDYLLSRRPDSTALPTMAVGRIAAQNPDMVKLYLDKVVEYENAPNVPQTIEDKAWMKRILHLGGGDPGIQATIRNDLNSLKSTIENSLYGAEVRSFFKNSTDVVTELDLLDEIDAGASMITFFGHSAPTTLDFDLGDVNQYNNKGKYPIFYAIGCNTNRVFEYASTLSEEYVFVKDKGAIAFIGTTWVTLLPTLSDYADYFYTNLGTDNYGDRLGTVLKATIEDYGTNDFSLNQFMRQVMMLHGDPALKVYSYDQPDYVVDKGKTSISPELVNVQSDNFEVDLALTNLGRGIEDSMFVKIEQELSNGSIQLLDTFKTFTPKNTIDRTVTLPVLKDAIGFNNLVVTVDSREDIEEGPVGAEMNNVAKIPFFIIANDAKPIYPLDYSIVGNESVTLKASTGNAFAQVAVYHFEMDTTQLFNSPLKQRTSIEQTGGLLEWQPSINYVDSTVYYWRVTIDSLYSNGSGENWHNRSFLYLSGVEHGFNKSHYYQFLPDDYTATQTTSDYRRQEFDISSHEFKVENGAFNPGVWGWQDLAIYIDGFKQYNFWTCGQGQQTLWAMSFDPVTGKRRTTPPGVGSAWNCFGTDAYFCIVKPNSTSERERMIQFLRDDVPDGDYVFFLTTQRTTNNYFADQWAADSITLGTNLFQVLENEGAELIRNTQTKQTPYLYFYKKGDPTYPTQEYHAIDINEIVNVTTFIDGPSDRGNIKSTKVGPAASWQSLIWNVEEFDPASDTFNFDLIGVNAKGQEVVLLDSIVENSTDISFVNASEYPYLKVQYNVKDSLDQTPPQLDYWRILYDPLPEAALVPNKHLAFHADTLERGEKLTLEVGIENIGPKDMDSMLVQFTVIDPNNNVYNSQQRLKPLLKDNQLVASYEFDTRLTQGRNQLIIDANPNNDQKELTHINNVGVLQFNVLADRKNPLLDVTFDGIRIMDGDIVSAKPNILIALEDENTFLALDDTSDFEIQIKYPEEEDFRRFEPDGETMIFYPADKENLDKENKARIELSPIFDQDGTYQMKIQGKDVAGNKAGDSQYIINFEVINKPMISNILNYPNPFSTSTQFVFTLTGETVPDDMKIQIMTVTGKIVKEIMMDELGYLHVGNNVTEYTWDGTDQYGDKLANGVYLYRVVARINGKEYENFDTGTGQYFKRGFGKMMILR